MDLLSSTLLVLLSFHGAKSAFSPSSPVSIDCGGQQTFTCTVAANGPATWTIMGLQDIVASGTNGVTAGINNARITTTDTTPGATSAITITGFGTADNGGTVRCADQLNAEEGIATVVVATLASATAVTANVDQCSATLTWSEPSDSIVNTSVSCTPSSPQCSTCTSSGCTIGGLNSSTSYTFSVTRSRSGCGDMTAMSSAVTTGAIPDCGKLTVTSGDGDCPSFVFTPGTIEPSTIRFSYSGASSSAFMPDCAYPIQPVMCQQSVSSGTYTVTAIPQSNCGSLSACPPTESTVIPDGCSSITITGALATRATSTGLDLGIIIAIIIAGLLLLLVVAIAVYFSIIGCLRWFCYAYVGCLGLIRCLCCPCCKGKARKSSSKQRIDSESPVTPPAQPPAQPSSDEYADPQAIRDRKEKGKEDKDKIQYAAIDFSAGAGSGAGEVKIHQKEEPVIYTAIQHV